MAREIQEFGGTRIVLSGDDTAPTVCEMEYRVTDKDGTNDDLFEPPNSFPEPSPNFNQTMTALCTGVGTTVKTNEGI